ncbi:MAG: 4-hydroxy-2-oxovalerate aldolase [Tissierellia bacterium]|nr:4-hydroxy-2-oxovalerate aldolase [Tissierellia bacterium]
MKLFDNTLRDGGNVVGHGFDADLTISILESLIDVGISDIEVGNCMGLSSYDILNCNQALTDRQYLEVIKPYLNKAKIGMFQLADIAREEDIEMAASYGINFLRVGANAGDGKGAIKAIKMVKKAGLVCRYAMMAVYLLSPEEVAKEAKMLQEAGVDKISLMDTNGTLLPKDVYKYVTRVKENVTISVGFHAHGNLGMAQANALAALEAGADEIDCGLLGLARSAGNCSTELALAAFQKLGYLKEIDLFKLLDYLDSKLIPAMKAYNYQPQVDPTYLMIGLSGAHSFFLANFQKVAKEEGVSLLRLIYQVSALEKRSPSEDLMRQVAREMRESM